MSNRGHWLGGGGDTELVLCGGRGRGDTCRRLHWVSIGRGGHTGGMTAPR